MRKFSKLFSMQGEVIVGYCYLCGDSIYSISNATVDHKEPFARSHDNSEKNKAIACKKCNCEKGMLTVEEYKIWKVLNLVRNGDKNPVNIRILDDLKNYLKQKGR